MYPLMEKFSYHAFLGVLADPEDCVELVCCPYTCIVQITPMSRPWRAAFIFIFYLHGKSVFLPGQSIYFCITKLLTLNGKTPPGMAGCANKR
jgi:hypothetical protein